MVVWMTQCGTTMLMQTQIMDHVLPLHMAVQIHQQLTMIQVLIRMIVHVTIIQDVWIHQHITMTQLLTLMMVVVHILQVVQIQEHSIMIHQPTLTMERVVT